MKNHSHPCDLLSRKPSRDALFGWHCWLVQQCLRLRTKATRTQSIPLLVFGLAIWLTPLSLHAQDKTSEQPSTAAFDAAHLETLRAKGSFAEAECYCLERVYDSATPQGQRLDVAVQLVRIYADHASQSRDYVERDAYWRTAEEFADNVRKNFAGHPRLILLEVQHALALLTRGEAAAREFELSNSAVSRDEREAARRCVEKLKNASEWIAKQLQQPASSPPTPAADSSPRDSPLSEVELKQLAKNVRYHLSQAYRNRARCEPAGGADWTDALAQSAELLDPLARLDLADPLALDSRLDLANCERMLGEFDAASRRLAALADKPLDAPQAARLETERIRLALAQGDIDAAIGRAEAVTDELQQSSAELALARLQAYLAAWKRSEAKKSADSARWQSKTVESLKGIAAQHGKDWERLAERMLAPEVTKTSELGLAMSAADGLYRDGKPDEAIAAYDKAHELAAAQLRLEEAFDMSYRAAAIEHQRKHHAQAMTRFRKLAQDMWENPRASEAHLLAIYSASQLALDETEPALAMYRELLDEHLRIWPDDATSGDVYRQQGLLAEHSGNWADAIAAYGRSRITRNIDVIPRAPRSDGKVILSQPVLFHSLVPYAVEGIQRCTENWIRERSRNGLSAREQALAAERALLSLVVDERGRPPKSFDDAQRSALVSATQLAVGHALEDTAQLADLLKLALEDKSTDGLMREQMTRLLWITEMQSSGQWDAQRLVSGLERTSSYTMASMLKVLDTLAGATTDHKRRDATALTIALTEAWWAKYGQPQGGSAAAVERYYVRALVRSGRIEEAQKRFAATSLTDSARLEDWATLLSEAADQVGMKAALAAWLEVERRSPPASDRWYRAKYNLALVHHQLGESQQAAKIIEVTQVLHPELGGPAWKERFLALLAKCRGR